MKLTSCAERDLVEKLAKKYLDCAFEAGENCIFSSLMEDMKSDGEYQDMEDSGLINISDCALREMCIEECDNYFKSVKRDRDSNIDLWDPY
jgi:hypothetical protein